MDLYPFGFWRFILSSPLTRLLGGEPFRIAVGQGGRKGVGHTDHEEARSPPNLVEWKAESTFGFAKMRPQRRTLACGCRLSAGA